MSRSSTSSIRPDSIRCQPRAVPRVHQTMTPHPVEIWLLCYDVADDRRRARLAAFLERSGERVQESVFEVLAATADLERLLEAATDEERFDPTRDSLRVYRLCLACRAVARCVGVGPEVLRAGRAVIL